MRGHSAQFRIVGASSSFRMPALDQMEPRQQRADVAFSPVEGPRKTGAPQEWLAWAARHRVRAMLAVGAAILSICAAIGGGVWVVVASGAAPEVTLDEVLALLEKEDYVRAKETAETLRNQKSASLDDLAGAVYALGVATAMEAGDTSSQGRQVQHLLAARYLEEARSRGFPPGCRGRGLFLLGRSLYKGGQIPASRPYLTEALRADPSRREESYRLLAAAYLEDASPDPEKALHYNTQYLAERTLPPTKHQDGLMQRAQILLAMGRLEECLATLDRIPAKSPLRAEATILRGRVQMRGAHDLKHQADPSPRQLEKARLQYEEAITTFQLAQGRDTLSNHATRKAMYLIGLCFREIGDSRAALRQFARTRQLFSQTPEAVAASLEEAELYRQLGRDEDAVAGYRRTLESLENPNVFSNPWITVRELRLRILDAYEYYLHTQNFAVALEIAELLHPLFPEVRALELKADAHRAWGGSLLSEAGRYAPGQAEPLLRAGRRQFRQSGRIHAQLADRLITTRRYPDQLWESGQDYMRGHSFTAAVEVLVEYLKDQARRRHPQALVMLGEAYLALGNTAEAFEAFQECIDFHPRDAAAYQARLLASRALRETGDTTRAEQLLLKNLAGEQLTPQSRQWRESLFDLGELLYQEGRYEEAVLRLEEAVVRYPDDARALATRYLLGESCRRAAKAMQKQRQESADGVYQLDLAQQAGRLFHEALDHFTELRDLLSDRQHSNDLTEAELAVLRNACFAIGDIEFALGRYPQAVEAYSNVTNRYQHSPEVLDAYVQIANAYRQMGEEALARSALEQAKSVLARMKPDLTSQGPTNFDRAQWTDLLETLSDL